MMISFVCNVSNRQKMNMLIIIVSHDKSSSQADYYISWCVGLPWLDNEPHAFPPVATYGQHVTYVME